MGIKPVEMVGFNGAKVEFVVGFYVGEPRLRMEHTQTFSITKAQAAACPIQV